MDKANELISRVIKRICQTIASSTRFEGATEYDGSLSSWVI